MPLVLLDTFAGTGTVVGHVPDVAPEDVVASPDGDAAQDLTISGGDARVPATYTGGLFGTPCDVEYFLWADGPGTIVGEPGLFVLEQTFTFTPGSDAIILMWYQHQLFRVFASLRNPTANPGFMSVLLSLNEGGEGETNVNGDYAIADFSLPITIRLEVDYPTATVAMYVNGIHAYDLVGVVHAPEEELPPGPWYSTVIAGINEAYSVASTTTISSVSLNYTPGAPPVPEDFWTSEILCQES